jgi:hypothetical protein
MALTERQRRITNPYANTVDTGFRRGVGYDYENEDNKFVLNAIHEKYLYFYEFPLIGTELRGRNRTITVDDMLAYFALHPQNGKVENTQVQKISDAEAIDEFQLIVDLLRRNNVLDKFTSDTSELTYQKEYRDNNIRPDLNQDVANLISIPPAHSKQYKNSLRKSLDLPEVQYSGDVNLDLLNLSPEVTTYISSDSNVDLYDWRKNGLPGEDNDRVYYNPIDSKYYYVKRTTSTETSEYAFNQFRTIDPNIARVKWTTGFDQEAKDRYNDAVNTGIREILKLTGKNSEENFQILSQKYSAPEVFSLLSYRNLRPGSRWIYCIQINSFDINNLQDAPESTNKPSYQEYELSSIQKAKRLIGEDNKSTRSVSFRVEDMLRYMFSVRRVLTEYNEKLLDDGLTPATLNGLDLGRETDRLESFFDLLELFYGYNKISLEDEDLVEMFFTEDYLLDHICINGSFYYQGCGNITYLNVSEEQARVANAFSLFTPTTFSFINNSYEIYNEVKNTTPSTREDALTFLSKYVFPSARLNAVRAKRANARGGEDEQRKKKRKQLFTKLAELSKTSPAEYERLFSNRPLSYRMSSTLQSIDCNTGQAKAAKYALRFWQAATGKTKVRSLIRETIILLRQEIIEDETTKRRLSDAGRWAASPAAELRSIERAINQQIFCSLDVLGDFIEDSFLDPIGAPPVANALVRKTLDEPIKIEFNKKSMISLKTKQSKVYRKAIETILLNFVKSIVAGIAKDIVSALLGCGPDGNKRPASGLKNSFKRQDFGFSDLTNFVDEVDLVDLAKRANLFNIDDQGQASDATLEQIQNLLEDVSQMSTPVELQQLLDGDGDDELIDHLFETLTSSQIVTYISPFSSPEERERVTINPNEYNSLNFSNDKIVDFFIILGDAIENQGQFGDLPFRSPLEAYCDQRESYTNPLELNFEIPEIEAQYSDIVSDKIKKINNLCNWLRDLANIRLELERLIDSLPTMTWYDDLLNFIANLSNSFTEWLAGLFSEMFDKNQKVRQRPEYNLYNSELGTQLFFRIFPALRNLSIHQLYRTNAGNTLFMTPASYVGGSNGRSAVTNLRVDEGGMGLEDDQLLYDGQFLQRRNSSTRDNVFSFIYGTPSPSLLPVPQYRDPPEENYQILDVGYYALRNAPESLREDLSSTAYGDLTSNANQSNIQYGGVRTNQERLYLSRISQITQNYWFNIEDESPYVGETGASILSLGNNINIFYWGFEDPNTPVATYDPGSDFYNEISQDSSDYALYQNGNSPFIDYRIFKSGGLTVGQGQRQTTIEVRDPNQTLYVGDVKMPSISTDDYFDLYSNFSVGLPKINPPPEERNAAPSERDSDIISIQNYRERTDTQINIAVINETGKRRMPRYVAGASKLPLTKTDDFCVTKEDVYRAESAIQILQTRMLSFFMNIMPLARVYPNWCSLGTTKIISDYLTKRILSDLKKKELLGPFYESIQYIKLVFPYDLEDSTFNQNPNIKEDVSAEENLKVIVEAMYLGMISNIVNTSEYKELRLSVLDPISSSRDRYMNSIKKLYQQMYNLQTRTFNQPYGLSEEEQLAARDIFANVFQGEGLSPFGMRLASYYMPIAFQIASYMIYYDTGIKYVNRFSDTGYRLVLERAVSDDELLTAIKGQRIEKYSEGLAAFPAGVRMWNGTAELNYYEPLTARERIEVLDQQIDSRTLVARSFPSLSTLLDNESVDQQQFFDFFSNSFAQIELDLNSDDNTVFLADNNPSFTNDNVTFFNPREFPTLKRRLALPNNDWDIVGPMINTAITREIFYQRDQLKQFLDNNRPNRYGLDPGSFAGEEYFTNIAIAVRQYFWDQWRPSPIRVPTEFVPDNTGLYNLGRNYSFGGPWLIADGQRTQLSAYINPDANWRGDLSRILPEGAARDTRWQFFGQQAYLNNLPVKKRMINDAIAALSVKFWYTEFSNVYMAAAQSSSELEAILNEKTILETLVNTNE